MNILLKTTISSFILILAIAGCVSADGGAHGPSSRQSSAPASSQYGGPSSTLSQYNNGDNFAAASDLNVVRAEGGNGIEDLKNSIPGVPGEDYPILAEVPELSFTCDGRVAGGISHYVLSSWG